MLKYLLLLIFCSNFVFAQSRPVSENEVQAALASTSHSKVLETRAWTASSYFLGTPYVLGSAGEGSEGDFDQKPLSTWEQFDCVTYVEAVLAIAMVYPRSHSAEKNMEYYYDNIKEIKYNNPHDISFLTRNHFTEIDWIPHQHRIELLKDVTRTIYPGALTQSKLIDKKKWFLTKTTADLYLPDLTEEEKQEKLQELKESVQQLNLKPVMATLSYIPFEVLKSKEIQKRLPNFTIFSLIRGEHPTNPNIPVMVSHQGFIIKDSNQEIFIRHASTKTMKVVDVPIDQYIEQRLKDSPWPSLGLNLQQFYQ